MPTYSKLPPNIGDQLKAKGLNPDDYLIDEAGNGVLASEVPVNPILEGAKGLGRGLVSSAVAPIEAAGLGADVIRQMAGNVGSFQVPGFSGDSSVLTQGTKAIKDKTAELLPADPRDPYFSSSLGEGAGGLLGLLLEGGGLAKGGQILMQRGAAKAAIKKAIQAGADEAAVDAAEKEAIKSIPNLARKTIIREGAISAADATAERENERQKAAGEDVLWKKVVKPTAAGLAAIPLMKLGPGKLLESAQGPAASGALDVIKRSLANVGFGAAGGGAQNLVEQGLVNGDIDPAEAGKAALVSGIVQGAAGAGMDALRGVRSKTPPKLEVAPDTVAPPAAYEYSPVIRDSLIAQAAKGGEIVAPIEDSVVKGVKALHKLGVPINEGVIEELAQVYGGNKANDKAVLEKANLIGHEWAAGQQPEPATPAEKIKSELEFNKQQDDARALVIAEDKAIQKMAEELQMMQPGDAWRSGLQEQVAERRQKNEERKNWLVNRGRTVLNNEKVQGVGGEQNIPEGLNSNLSQVSAELPTVPQEGGFTTAPQNPTEAMRLQDWMNKNAGGPSLENPLVRQPRPMEGEQGLPFAGRETIEPVDPHRPNGAYSGLPVGNVRKGLGKLFKGLGLLPEGEELPNLNPAAWSESVATTLAKDRGYSGALLSYNTHPLLQERFRLQNKGALPLAEMMKLIDTETGKLNEKRNKLKDERFINWLHDSTDNQTWDISKLPAELRDLGETVVKLIKEPHDEQRAANVGVETVDEAGNRFVRPAEDVEGYFPWQVSDAARRARRDGGPAWQKIEAAWFREWEKQHHTDDPNWREVARKQLMDVFGDPFQTANGSGEPTFSAVRRAHGTVLPREMRSNDIVKALESYYDRSSADVAYGKVIQHNPALRRVLGMVEDPMGVDTRESDPITWKQAPEAWRQAVTEGLRQGAEWAENADINNPPDEPIHQLVNDDLTKTWMASYRQRPMGGVHSQTWSVGTQLGSALLLETFSGIRDAGSATANTYREAGLRNTIKGIVSTLESGGFARPMRKGAMQADPSIAHLPVADSAESAVHWFAKAMANAAKAVRTGTLRQMMDNYSRAVGYNTIYEAIKAGHGAEYVERYGPVGEGKLTLEQIADKTANRYVAEIANPPDMRTLPPSLIPQSNSVWSMMLGLSKWPVAQFNSFHRNVYRPALKGNIKPLVRTLLGGTAVPIVVNGITQALTNTKPTHLTWAEWLNLSPEEDKAKEFFYTWLGYDRALGTFGYLSDILYPVAKAAAGDKFRPFDATPQNAGVIATTQMMDVFQKYLDSWDQHKSASLWDLPKLALEVAKTSQVIRALANYGDEDREKLRYQKLFERQTKMSAKSGELLSVTSDITPPTRPNPFSLEKQVWDAKDKDDWDALRPVLKEAYMRKGEEGLPKLKKYQMSEEYYLWLWRKVGEKEMRRMMESDVRKDAEGGARKMKMLQVISEK